jgi:hypothetical protein
MIISTTNLEEYFDLVIKTENKINSQLINCWEYFGYPNKELFTSDIELLIQTIYPDLQIIKESNARLSQTEFRNGLIQYYNSKCAITQNNSLEELEAAHIVELKDGGEYDVSNGFLLEANLHKTFDRYLWTINPDTLIIEAEPNKITNTVKNYIGKKVNLQLNPFLYTNLKKRYDIFLEKNSL